MADITLYTTHCPKCKILEKKLNDKGIEYNEITDINTMLDLGFDATPILAVDGVNMNFTEANNWINTR